MTAILNIFTDYASASLDTNGKPYTYVESEGNTSTGTINDFAKTSLIVS